MSDKTDTLASLLKPYGLSDDEAEIYLYLLKNRSLTALAISRTLHIGRTRVYRILDRLVSKQLVLEKLGERGFEFEAAPPQRLEQLALEKELEAQAVKEALPSIVGQLEHLLPNPSKKSKVLFYEGLEGLKQVNYNTVHAKQLLRVFEVAHMSEFLDPEFAESVRQKQVDNAITTYDITNRRTFPGFTDIPFMIEKFSQFRYIDTVKLNIQFEVLIYNDVYATYTYAGDEIFCVEIYNEQLAAMQKQLFDFIWAQAIPMKFLDKRGAAIVV